MPLSHLSSSVKHIILDFGGVLFDIDYDLPVKAFAKLGYTDFDKIYTQSFQSELFDGLETGRYHEKEFLDAVRPKVRAGVSDEEILEAWHSILLDIPKHRVEFLHRLKDHYDLYLLSNTNSLHVERFEVIMDKSVGLSHFKSAFKKVYYSNAIGIKKPYPETYLEVCKWNDLNPEECLFIDDSKQHVDGAAKAGLHAYHIDVTREDITEVLGSWVE
jgi:HAD superfamily hydrolase (TIGR01509 family)